MVIRGEKKRERSHRSVVNHKSYERFYTSIVSHRGRLEVRREQCAAGPPQLQDVGPQTYMLFLHRCSDFMCRIC